MTDESYGFTAARARLEEIVAQVRKKDTSLEKSLDLLEEGVRLANVCTEQIDHADWAADTGEGVEGAVISETAEDAETIAIVEEVVVVDEEGDVVAEMVEVTRYEPLGGVDDETAAAADDPEAAYAEPESSSDDEDDLRD